MPRTVQLSGAQKRKKFKESRKNHAEILEKMSRVTDFFVRTQTPNAESSPISSGTNQDTSASLSNQNVSASLSNQDANMFLSNQDAGASLSIQDASESLSNQDAGESLSNKDASESLNDQDASESFSNQDASENFSKALDRNLSSAASIANPDALAGNSSNAPIYPDVETSHFRSTINVATVSTDTDAVDLVRAESFSSVNSDPATWFPITAKHISHWSTVNNIINNQNNSDTYPESRRLYQAGRAHSRYFKNSFFYSTYDNGEKYMRKWLLYSPSKGTTYCFYCTLMSSKRNRFSTPDGFNDWKKAEEKMKAHEKSECHRESVLKFNHRCEHSRHVDRQLHAQIAEEKKYWTEVMRRVVAVIVFLAERGLAFRGSQEILGSKHNGNFLGIMELIAQFDPFLMSHLKEYGNKGRGKQSYLSPTIYEEMILLMENRVKDFIISELQAAKYFSISVDSTPDKTKVDQLVVIVRYVVAGKPVERFLTLLQVGSHKAEKLVESLLNFLDKVGIDFKNCRGQSYDNASNMSGCISGVQARLKDINTAAVFIPCSAHSLNLVGVKAASSCVRAISYFGFIQKLYVFFL